MTNPDIAHTLIIVDRSGSMAATKGDAEGGLRNFLNTMRDLHREENGVQHKMHVTLSLAQFDNHFEWVHTRRNLSDAGPYHLVPRGSTALLDAIGRAVVEEGERLAKLPEDERPGKVAVVIVTDGMENASREWTLPDVRQLVEQQKRDYAWEFIFLASDLDAINLGASVGTRTTHFQPTGEGTRRSYAVAAAGVADWYTGQTANVDTPDKV